MEGLDFSNIMDASDFFSEEATQDSSEETQASEETTEDTSEPSDTVEEQEVTEEEAESLFSEIEEEEEKDIQETPKSGKERSSQPKKAFYSSIASALAEEGVFPDLDDEIIDSISSPEDFTALVESEIQKKLTTRQKRIDMALSYGVQPNDIQVHENAINFLNSVSEEHLTDEGEQGSTLRKQLIYQDYINRGYTHERAVKEVDKSFNAATDIDDAREALDSALQYYTESYKEIIEDSKARKEEYEAYVAEENKRLKSLILEDSELSKSLDIDKNVRKKAYDNISKPMFKDKQTGEVLTTIQKAERENRAEFLRGLSIAFTLTNGFKDLGNLAKGAVNKKVNSKMKELETKISTSSSSNGNYTYVTSVDTAPSDIKIRLDM